MKEDLKDRDILLVKEKGGNELKAAKMDNDGKITQAKPDSENPDLLKIDKNGNILENFFDNFMRQVKNPTQFEFFRVPAEKFQEVVQKLQDALRNPDTAEKKQFIDMHRVEPNDYLQKQAQTSEKSYAIDPNLVDWYKMEKFGITRDSLEKSGNLEKMLDYRKTDLLPVTIKIDDETTIRTDARFSLRKQDDGSFAPAIHPIRHKPDLERPYFGVTFTEEDKQNLLKTGNLGRIAEAEFQKGVKTPIILSLDKLTNELIACRADRIKIPENIKGVALNEQQKKELMEGKAVWIENMTSKTGANFSAYLQFNADKRGLEFRFDNDKNVGANLSVRPNLNVCPNQEQKDIPKTFRKKLLTEDQRSSLGEGKTVHIDGLEDRKGKKYSGYITLNQETGKIDFMFPKDYKDALAAGKVIPDDRHKTQVAVNSEGKTNETTKKANEPLDKGQTQPTEKQAKEEKQEQKKKTGKKVS